MAWGARATSAEGFARAGFFSCVSTAEPASAGAVIQSAAFAVGMGLTTASLPSTLLCGAAWSTMPAFSARLVVVYVMRRRDVAQVVDDRVGAEGRRGPPQQVARAGAKAAAVAQQVADRHL